MAQIGSLLVLLGLTAATPSRGLAQSMAARLSAPDEALVLTLATPVEPAPTLPGLAGARARYHSGTAMVGEGLSTLGVGLSLLFTAGSSAGFIGGITAISIGSLAVLVGVPTWVAGAVQKSIASAGERGPLAADRWELAGAILFGIHIGIALLGGILLAAAYTQRFGNGIEIIAGSTLISAGGFVAAFVAAPMWAEAARF